MKSKKKTPKKKKALKVRKIKRIKKPRVKPQKKNKSLKKRRKVLVKRKKVVVKKKIKLRAIKRKATKQKKIKKKITILKPVAVKTETKLVVDKVKEIVQDTFDSQAFFKPRIKVIGLGGGGGSIVSEIGKSLGKATFVIADTDTRFFGKKR